MRPITPFIAVLLGALTLIPGGAHLFELPNKIALPQEQYFTVQNIYRGWWMLGLLLVAAVVANGAFAVAFRDQPRVMSLAAAATAFLIGNLFIFFIWTQPANAATQNWTVAPENWRALRAQWEYSHAVNAFILFAAFVATTLAAFRAQALRP